MVLYLKKTVTSLPSYQDYKGNTVAMYLALHKIPAPMEWWHNPELRNKDRKTVCYYLWLNGTYVPDYW